MSPAGFAIASAQVVAQVGRCRHEVVQTYDQHPRCPRPRKPSGGACERLRGLFERSAAAGAGPLPHPRRTRPEAAGAAHPAAATRASRPRSSSTPGPARSSSFATSLRWCRPTVPTPCRKHRRRSSMPCSRSRSPHIVVMGHAQCGGIRAYAQDEQNEFTPLSEANFVAKWKALIAPAAEQAGAPGSDFDSYCEDLGRASIVQGLANLRTYPLGPRARGGRRTQSARCPIRHRRWRHAGSSTWPVVSSCRWLRLRSRDGRQPRQLDHEKALPPSSLPGANSMVPPWARTRSATMARPSPVPPGRDEFWNAENTLPRIAGGMPGPVSGHIDGGDGGVLPGTDVDHGAIFLARRQRVPAPRRRLRSRFHQNAKHLFGVGCQFEVGRHRIFDADVSVRHWCYGLGRLGDKCAKIQPAGARWLICGAAVRQRCLAKADRAVRSVATSLGASR